MALLCGWVDGTHPPAETFEWPITVAVQLGYDTDCDGATAGSLIGLVLGASALPEKCTAPMNDTLRTSAWLSLGRSLSPTWPSVVIN